MNPDNPSSRPEREDQLIRKNYRLQARLAKLRGSLRQISKMWHDDCGCMVECKIACETLAEDDKEAEK